MNEKPPHFVIPAKAGIQKGRGKTTRRWKITGTSPDFHPLMRPSQVHGDSGEELAPYSDTGPESRAGKSVLASHFSKRCQGVLVNHNHLELLSENS